MLVALHAGMEGARGMLLVLVVLTPCSALHQVLMGVVVLLFTYSLVITIVK